ncbi:helix-turn-helix domain-containing protein [Gordonia sp. HY442]|uniref:helix-turn-helix domain-containing protein n=1 Tax=Gordonia zhenghanii TaxID=2911516 RepID=UPI001EFFC56D|nr:helix-turn-helix domain-containing protein [Gordonia zhenghanii]MCF8602118.1 helix-turn-helix domain-containing protein [Gordonia zhenghanii]
MSARRSPQTERLTDVVDYLGGVPARATLTDVASALGVDKSTLHPMLAELTARGWVVRDPRTKAYRLGPALVRIGRVAQRRSPEFELIAEAVADLSAATGQPCCGVVTSGESMVVAELHGPRVVSAGSDMRPGDHIALQAPLGATLVAWEPPNVVNRWLIGTVDRSVVGRHRQALAAVRGRRFGVAQYPPGVDRFEEMSGLVRPRREARGAGVDGSIADVLVGDLDRSAHYRALSVDAPVVGAEARPIGVLCVLGEVVRSGADIAELGGFVRAAADSVSRTVAGRGQSSAANRLSRSG